MHVPMNLQHPLPQHSLRACEKDQSNDVTGEFSIYREYEVCSSCEPSDSSTLDITKLLKKKFVRLALHVH